MWKQIHIQSQSKQTYISESSDSTSKSYRFLHMWNNVYKIIYDSIGCVSQNIWKNETVHQEGTV